MLFDIFCKDRQGVCQIRTLAEISPISLHWGLYKNNKKGMRLMCSCPFTCRYRQTPLLERFDGTYLTPDVMLMWLAYTHKRKQKCSVLQLDFLANLQVRTVSQCFSALTYLALVSSAKIRFLLNLTKSLSNMV